MNDVEPVQLDLLRPLRSVAEAMQRIALAHERIDRRMVESDFRFQKWWERFDRRTNVLDGRIAAMRVSNGQADVE